MRCLQKSQYKFNLPVDEEVLVQSGSQRNAIIVYCNCTVLILINIFELTQTIVQAIILTRP